MVATVAAPETIRPYTYEDLLAFPEDNIRREIITGELIVSPSPTPNHQKVSMNLSFIVRNYLESNQIGELFASPIDVRINEEDVVAPDLLFISNERMEIVREKTIVGGPDLVIEILSPSTKRYDLVQKQVLYRRAGVQEYWIVDIDKRELRISELRNDTYVPVPLRKGIHISKLLKGLELNPERIFKGIKINTADATKH